MCNNLSAWKVQFDPTAVFFVLVPVEKNPRLDRALQLRVSTLNSAQDGSSAVPFFSFFLKWAATYKTTQSILRLKFSRINMAAAGQGRPQSNFKPTTQQIHRSWGGRKKEKICCYYFPSNLLRQKKLRSIILHWIGCVACVPIFWWEKLGEKRTEKRWKI